MGPFGLINATGVTIAYHAQKTLEVFGGFYKVAEKLKEQAELAQNWEIKEPAEDVNIDPQVKSVIREKMLGAVYVVCSQILDEKICSPSELNRGARSGLCWRKGPVDLMLKSGEDEVKHLVKIITDKYNMPVPSGISKYNWKLEFVELVKKDNRAIITMARPEDMNALNEVVINQLAEKFDDADKDEKIDTIFFIGSGKAFVAGADIKFFIKNIKSDNIPQIESFTKFGHEVFERIDNSHKKVVALINGLTLGGGLELALCADVIIAVPKAVVAFPETGIGIYPGLGGTQRTVGRVGKGLSKYLIYTGKMTKAADAEQIGLVDEVIETDGITEILDGRKKVPDAKPTGKTLSEKWIALDDFFENNSIVKIMSGEINPGNLPEDEVDKLSKIIKGKAPLALKTAEKLIDEAKGCDSELEELQNIFSTFDALLGLSSIGKRVEFQGK